MKSKKSLSGWMTAGIYFIAFFVILQILEFIFQILEQNLLFALHISIDNSSFQTFLIYLIIFSYIITILAIYLAAKLIKKYFVLKNIRQIIIWATAFNLILSVIFIGRDVFFNPHLPGMTSIGTYEWTAFSTIFGAVLFYFFSLQFLQGTTLIPRIKMIYTKQLKPGLP